LGLIVVLVGDLVGGLVAGLVGGFIRWLSTVSSVGYWRSHIIPSIIKYSYYTSDSALVLE
jgi:hypothetical protein